MERKKATYSAAFFAYLIGIVVLLSNTNAFSESLTFGSKNIFDWFDFISSAILLPLGGMIMSIFIGFVLDKEVSRNAIDFIENNFTISTVASQHIGVLAQMTGIQK